MTPPSIEEMDRTLLTVSRQLYNVNAVIDVLRIYTAHSKASRETTDHGFALAVKHPTCHHRHTRYAFCKNPLKNPKVEPEEVGTA
jgi:hypothetical protein